jgi:hypothetical protein
MQGEKYETSKEQETNAKQKKQQETEHDPKKHIKSHINKKKKPPSFCISLLSFVVSLVLGAALNLKTLNPKPKSNLPIFPPRPQRTGFRFSCENSYCSFFLFKKILIPVLVVGSHIGENLKTSFHPK